MQGRRGTGESSGPALSSALVKEERGLTHQPKVSILEMPSTISKQRTRPSISTQAYSNRPDSREEKRPMALPLSSEKSPSSLWLSNRTSYIMLNDLSQRKKHPYHMMALVRSTSCSHSQTQTVAQWQAVKRQKRCAVGMVPLWLYGERAW